MSTYVLSPGFPGSSEVPGLLPAMQETSVKSLGQEDPVKKEMATHSSVLAWKDPVDGGDWQATVYGITKSGRRLSD